LGGRKEGCHVGGLYQYLLHYYPFSGSVDFNETAAAASRLSPIVIERAHCRRSTRASDIYVISYAARTSTDISCR
jgi:hypothetical protein